MTTSVNQIKCACPSCVCIVNLSDAIDKDAKHYCSEACAQGHPDGVGCTHSGCNCNG
jgi:hypothetical protein